MSATRFTKMQQAAIDILNKNILVSAAAGSGKTAVLVERIIQRILSEENPIDIDRILVMTFTRAAASQMKERILKAINEKRSENPQDKNLSKQYALVHNAYIMTIDSFCMNVVRNHFEEIGLSPDFRMADEAEITLLKKDVLDEVLEEFYEAAYEESHEQTEDFLTMTEIFASKKTDLSIENLVLSLQEYAESYPDPIKWLEDSNNGSDNSWIEIYVNYAKGLLKYLRNMLDTAGDICSMEFGPKPYLSAIESDICMVDSLMNFNTYEELYEKCVEHADLSFVKLGTVTKPKGDQVTEEEIEKRTQLKDRAKDLRDKYKVLISELINDVISMSPEDVKIGMDMMKQPVSQLVKLTRAFIERFEEEKRKMNIVDFGDIEHMCLQILRNGVDTTAKEYREFFEEIYVDEYQDSNFVQEEIVNLIARKGEDSGNVFMVGDVKQSIYGFRNAKPEIFIEKYEKFDKYPEDGRANQSVEIAKNAHRDVKIDLSHNFRSRGEVLNSVNSLFEKIMTKDLGGIEYDEAASLHQGREFIDTGYDYTTELNLFVSDKDLNDKEAEALMVANKIKDLMKNAKVEDDTAKDGYRPLKYSDIVILLRSAKGYDNVFQNVLESQGIPVFVTASSGYFETIEIKTLLNFLKIIDNPLQDIPLAAVMMSMIGGFFEEEVARIRGEFKDGSLYDAVIAYNEKYNEVSDDSAACTDGVGMTSALAKKVKDFIFELSYYRKKSEYAAVTDILTEIIDDEYGKIIKAMPDGERRYANLNMLLKKAIEYGKTSYKGIFQFNRYIEAIRKYEIDYGEANLSDESDNTVRIMSIHKSKGLEFPICFVSGMNKKFNMMDTREAVLTDGKYGIATDIIDIKRRVKSKSLYKVSIAKKKQSEIIAEELRLLYVAMTRAKEKLILTGVVKGEENFRNSFIMLDKASSYLDMYTCAANNGELEGINLSFVEASDLVSEVVKEELDLNVSRARLMSIIMGDEVVRSKRAEEIMERIEYVYPYEDKGYVKLSVSELKHRSETIKDDESMTDADVTATLSDIQDNELDEAQDVEDSRAKEEARKIAAMHGTAVHRVFELWDYNRPKTMDSVRDFLAYIREEMLMEADLCDLVNAEEVYDFVNSEIAERMGVAYKRGELFREQPFVICDDELDPESMLVQGMIDAFFYEEGKVVLVDYKTDKVNSERILCERHKVQLDYYGKALSRLLHKELKESVIYSTCLKKSIII